MAPEDMETWAARAQRVLTESKHHTGAARRAVLELLDSQDCALSAIEIEDALRTSDRPVGRASVYRILDQLERLHLVQKVQVGQTMARYEPIRDGDGHHHHMVCDSCGAVDSVHRSRPRARDRADLEPRADAGRRARDRAARQLPAV